MARGRAPRLILSGIFLLETYGVVHTSAANAGLIISLTMIFTPLAEAAVTRTRPSRAFLGAAAVSVLGVVLLTQGGGFTRPSLGDLLMLLAALARTVHMVAMARVKAVQGAGALPLTLLLPGRPMDRAGGLGQGQAGALAGVGDDLRCDGHGGLLRRARAEVEADGGTQPGRLILGYARFAQEAQACVVGAAGSPWHRHGRRGGRGCSA